MSKRISQLLPTLLIIAILIVLAACGGGTGNNDTETGQVSDESSMLVSSVGNIDIYWIKSPTSDGVARDCYLAINRQNSHIIDLECP